MNIKIIAGVLCAVGMFLFGIDVMSDGLTLCCGEKIKSVLASCTKNRFRAMLTGLFVTAVLQSSCAVTVMTVSFVDCGVLSLSQSVGIIMGSNIGTTVTSLILSGSFSLVAPIGVFAGAIMKLFFKNEKVKALGLVVCGFGLIFVAMSSMGEYLSFFKESGSAQRLISLCSNPLSCAAVGFLITTVMQSSSATVGVLQSAVFEKIVPLQSAVYILFGQNIGAVVPTLLASVKAKPAAKKSAVVHLLFNVFSTVGFLFVVRFTPYVALLEKIENKKLAVSVAHVAFNVLGTAVLLPFSSFLAKLADKIVSFRPRLIR